MNFSYLIITEFWNKSFWVPFLEVEAFIESIVSTATVHHEELSMQSTGF